MIENQGPTPTHTVVSGDTLSEIAQKYKVSVADLTAWNEIKDASLIKVGQVIKVGKPSEDFIYTVVKGDTVSGLAQRFGKRWVDIAVYNKLEDINLIYIGQKLLIPGQGVVR